MAMIWLTIQEAPVIRVRADTIVALMDQAKGGCSIYIGGLPEPIYSALSSMQIIERIQGMMQRLGMLQSLAAPTLKG
jgi:hypothetical protein